MTQQRDDIPEFLRDALETAAEGELEAQVEGVVGLSNALAAAPAALSAGRARLLGAIAAPAERYAPLYDKLSDLFDLPLAALREIFERAAKPAEWEPGPLPSVSLFHFPGGQRVAGFDTGLVRLRAGSVFPRHRHQAEERVLIVDGSYEDDGGRIYLPGDWHHMAAGSEHRLLVSPERDALLAVVLLAEIVVLEAP